VAEFVHQRVKHFLVGLRRVDPDRLPTLVRRVAVAVHAIVLVQPVGQYDSPPLTSDLGPEFVHDASGGISY